MANLFTLEKIFDEDIILVYFIYFSSCLLLLLINVKGAKDANIGNSWLKGAYAKISYIKSSDTDDPNTKGIYIMGAYSGDVCIKSICIRGIYDMSNYIWSTGIGSIYSSAHKLNKFSV